ncbi:hypothetical protein VdG2_07314 [Verticillium dahliae VDG2]|nr:hypothetical protein VdG2_07314 [Verticillium dahliae VDG2]
MYDRETGQVYRETVVPGAPRGAEADWARRVDLPSWRGRSGRGVQGPRSLADMAMHTVAENVGSLSDDHLGRHVLPARMLWRIWRLLENRGICFQAWKTFSKLLLAEDGDKTLDLYRFRHHICRPSQDLARYLQPLQSTSPPPPFLDALADAARADRSLYLDAPSYDLRTCRRFPFETWAFFLCAFLEQLDRARGGLEGRDDSSDGQTGQDKSSDEQTRQDKCSDKQPRQDKCSDKQPTQDNSPDRQPRRDKCSDEQPRHALSGNLLLPPKPMACLQLGHSDRAGISPAVAHVSRGLFATSRYTFYRTGDAAAAVAGEGTTGTTSKRHQEAAGFMKPRAQTSTVETGLPLRRRKRMRMDELLESFMRS